MVGKLRQRVSVLPLLVGVLAVAIAVAGITALIAKRGESTTVWVAALDIEADRAMTADDVRGAVVSGAIEFGHLPVSELTRDDLVAGYVPRLDIAAGTPLSLAQFYRPGEFVEVEPGSVTVAVLLPRSRLPAGIGEGDTVLLVGVPGSTSPEAVAQGWPGSVPLQEPATVVEITDHSSGADVTLTVAVDREIGDDAAWLAAENRLVVAHDR
jgi:hypothetical protein